LGEQRRAGVHPTGEKQHLQGHGHRVGVVVAREGRENSERLVRLPRHQVAGHLHPGEVITGEAAGFDELGEIYVAPACRVCNRRGSYRLARLAAKYGPEIALRDLTERFSYDCMWRAEARSKKGKSDCGVYLPDLEHRRPPDLPPGMVKLRLVKTAEGK
jgi:hypothetical protein